MSEELAKCPFCGSTRILSQRHDTDWGGGHDTNCVNPDHCYSQGDQDAGGDIDIFVCIACDFIWGRWSDTPAKIGQLRAELVQARAYAAALIDGMTSEQFCAVVDAGKVDGIRAWLETEPGEIVRDELQTLRAEVARLTAELNQAREHVTKLKKAGNGLLHGIVFSHYHEEVSAWKVAVAALPEPPVA